jgi:small subunit ribosomal protein S6
MIERYRSMVESDGGSIHRLEDWGRRQLAYPVHKVHKAHYVLMNIECTNDSLDGITSAFKFNDAVIRHLIIRRDSAPTDSSPLAKSKEKDGRDDRGSRGRRRDSGETQSAESGEERASSERGDGDASAAPDGGRPSESADAVASASTAPAAPD